MTLSTLTFYGGDIPDPSDATPGLWNRRFSVLSQNLDQINAAASPLNLSGVTGAPVLWQTPSVQTYLPWSAASQIMQSTGANALPIATGTPAFSALSVGTLTTLTSLVLTGVTVTGAPTWSSTQTLNTSGNAGTATALATGRTLSITGDLAYTSPSFDGTANVTAAGTLATVATAGTTGSSTAIPVITINAKGLTTSITTAVVIAPAGTLTGTTLAANVVTSSLTTIGTLVAGAVPASLVTAGTFPTGTFVLPGTLNMTSATLNLTTATVSGSPTWSSNQAITLSTASQPNVTTMSALVTVGALASGSIAAGFGNINNASNSLTTGAITGTGLTLNGTDAIITQSGATQLHYRGHNSAGDLELGLFGSGIGYLALTSNTAFELYTNNTKRLSVAAGGAADFQSNAVTMGALTATTVSATASSGAFSNVISSAGTPTQTFLAAQNSADSNPRFEMQLNGSGANVVDIGFGTSGTATRRGFINSSGLLTWNYGIVVNETGNAISAAGNIIITSDTKGFLWRDAGTTHNAFLGSVKGWLGSGSNVTDAAIGASGDMYLYPNGSGSTVVKLTTSTLAMTGSISASTSVLSTILDSNAASDLLLKRNGTTKVTVGASGVTFADAVIVNGGETVTTYTSLTSGSATTILSLTSSHLYYVIIQGDDGGTSAFLDVVVVKDTGIAPATLSSSTLLGVVGARTYTNSGNTLKLNLTATGMKVAVWAFQSLPV